MESRDLVSVSRPIFASLGFRLEGFRSRHFEYCKEMVYLNFYNSTIFFVVFSGKKLPKHVGKWQIFEKIQLRSDDNVFLKKFGKTHKF